MNRNRIIEILESYRPGEGLEADPEVQEALAIASGDPELAEFQREAQLFDEVFGEKVRDIDVPETLYADILAAAGIGPKQVAFPPQPGRKSNILSWIHPAAFAAAAAIVLLLALSFTFWNRPEAAAPFNTELAQTNPVMATAHSLYSDLNPAFKSRNGELVRDYLQNRGSIFPAGLPSGFAWDQSFACDVIEVDGKKVSLVCFSSADGSDKLHLFTFYRSDFPGVSIPEIPLIHKDDEACSATWCDDEQIHVLYSDSGNVENLRQVLDI